MTKKTDEKKFRFDIIRHGGGKVPNKWDLARALMDGEKLLLRIEFSQIDDRARPPMGIEADGFHNVEVTLTSVETEDGSHQSWNLVGYVTIGEQSGRFNAYLRTDRRTEHSNLGFLFFIPNPF